MYMHANVPTSYVVPTLYRESGYALTPTCAPPTFLPGKKQKSVSTVHYPLQQLVCVFVLTWSSKSSKSLKAHYSTSLNQQMKDELVSSTLYSTRIFERAVLMKN